MWFHCFLALAVSTVVCHAAPLDHNLRCFQVAQPAEYSPQSPALSDVCMRLFDANKKEATLTAGKEYHITRGVWSYINDPDFIAQVRNLGWHFQGTLNGNTTNPDYALLDRDGQRLEIYGDRFWADPTKPGYREEYLHTAKQWIDNGAASLQRDDAPFGQWHWWRKRDPIPEEELVEFHTWARREIEAYAGRKITISVNEAQDRAFMKCFDYRMTEVPFKHMHPSTLLELARKARQQKMPFVITSQEDRPAEDFRRAWAGAYATGSLFVVPWDQFNVAVLSDPNARRTFIDPSQLADLTGFVRASAHYLDGYEDAFTTGGKIIDSRWDNQTPPVTVRNGTGKVYAFVRAKPGQSDAPVLIHLIDWAAKPESFQLCITPKQYFKNAKVRCRLLTPAAYNPELHRKAWERKDYQSLSSVVELQPECDNFMTIPALDPWGIVVIEPAI